MFNAVNLNLVAFSRFLNPPALTGQIFAVFIITVAAAEVAVGVALVLSLYRNFQHINVDDVSLMKG
jgi:NADH-quinone oxidoreductase subunit K